jgi:hypothetical protein
MRLFAIGVEFAHTAVQRPLMTPIFASIRSPSGLRILWNHPTGQILLSRIV